MQGVSHELTADLDRQADEALEKYARSKKDGDAHLLALYRARVEAGLAAVRRERAPPFV